MIWLRNLCGIDRTETHGGDSDVTRFKGCVPTVEWDDRKNKKNKLSTEKETRLGKPR